MQKDNNNKNWDMRMLRDKLLTKYSETTNEVYVNGLGHMGDVFTPK